MRLNQLRPVLLWTLPVYGVTSWDFNFLIFNFLNFFKIIVFWGQETIPKMCLYSNTHMVYTVVACAFYHKCTSVHITNNHHISARVKVIERQRERCRRATVIDRGQLERKQRLLSPTHLMMHQFPAALKTLVLPQLLPNCGHIKYTQRHKQRRTEWRPANRNSISLLFFCLLFISWIPREASKAALSVSPLTVLCVCHSSLVKIKSHNHIHACAHTYTHTHAHSFFSQLRIPTGKIIPFRGELFFCHYPL